ncbi:hypothetical protein, partial [Streptomyces sp. NPDC004579]|uniref:hypothetical protein n=1 Tax=Streptomyces sp. NPDC004579 TaxID=3154667 RepID=UPI0033AA2803
SGYSEGVYSFANIIHTHEGGTHEEGFRAALTVADARKASANPPGAPHAISPAGPFPARRPPAHGRPDDFPRADTPRADPLRTRTPVTRLRPRRR